MYGEAAALYDVLHEARGKDYRAEAARVLEAIRSRKSDAARLLDVACGSGGHLQWLASDLEAEGIDLSEDMLALAATRCPGVPLHLGDMRTFDLGKRFDAVVCLFSSIGYATGDGELEGSVANMARHLVPGGVLIVEPWIHPETWLEDRTVMADAATSDDIAAARVVRTRREGDITEIEMRYVAVTSAGISTFDEHHRMRLYRIDEYAEAFRHAGLAVEHDPVGLIGRGLFVGVAS